MFFQAHYLPTDSIYQQFNIEIDEQSDLPAAETKVSQQLRVVNGSQSINGFEFNNDKLVHEDVDAIVEVEENSFVPHWELKLPLERNLAQGQLVADALFISGFEQPGTKGTMNLYGAPNNSFRQSV
jgi:hypothetical protein